MNHFYIRLTTQELDYIANLLAQQPWAQVNALLANIKGQIDKQQQEQKIMTQQKEQQEQALAGEQIRPINNTAYGPNGKTHDEYLADAQRVN